MTDLSALSREELVARLCMDPSDDEVREAARRLRVDGARIAADSVRLGESMDVRAVRDGRFAVILRNRQAQADCCCARQWGSALLIHGHNGSA